MSLASKIILLLVMIGASLLAMTLRPTHKIADDGQKVNLETMIPKHFGDWQEAPQPAQIVNPVQKAKLEEIYSQTLSRTYVKANGEVIMLSIAYGADQSDAKEMHYPEVCYPAQGFQVVSTQPGIVKTGFGDIRVKRLLTVLGSRSEPLTYWTTVGTKVVVGGKEPKLEKLRYGFRGEIPDGLLFRVSSITQDTESGYASQQNFVRELISSLSEGDRLKLAGLPVVNSQH